MLKVLAFSERKELLDELLSFLNQRADEVDVICREGFDPSGFNVKNVYYFTADLYDPWQAVDTVSNIFSNGYDYLFVGASTIGREIAALVSQKLGYPMESDIFEFQVKDGKTLIKRYYFGGKTVMTKETEAKVFTLLPGSTEIKKGGQNSYNIQKVDLMGSPRTKLLGIEEKARGAVDITKAQIIVSVGRGIGKKDGIELAKQLAQKLGGELAGSRPICSDLHWLEEDRQVGLSGKKVRPKIYIALGISGQIQHIVGMRDSKIVIAINKDKNAPIFNEADYGIVGDIYNVVPMLLKKLEG
ncbi:MAG: electron transfer flavoprotein subunit alpha/FixB family protein [Nitrososphaeria archaeon]